MPAALRLALARSLAEDAAAGDPVGSWVEQAQLIAVDGGPFDALGQSVAMEGDTALVGAADAVYVFTRSGGTWSEQAKLTADDGVEGDHFGESVALAGDTALVGARDVDVDGNCAQGAAYVLAGDECAEGAAYVFTRSGGTWNQQAKLTAGDGAGDDEFGIAVALAGDAALVGAWGADVAAMADQGAAYVFTRDGDTWSQRAKLIAGDGAGGDEFGGSVALAGDTALIGANEAAVGDNDNTGAAYVFTRSGDTWSQQAKLAADEGVGSNSFGSSVALAGDTALVGAPFTDVDGNTWQGTAYVFTRSGGTWSQQAELTADDGAEGDRFGFSVALAGDTALVGAAQLGSPSAPASTGAAYVFTGSGDTWSQQVKLTANDGAAGDALGSSVAFAGDTALAGATGVDVGGNANQGAAYVFVRPLVPAALAVDPEPMASADGNGIFEPGETVDVAPAWRSNGTAPLGLMGTASGFTGPPGATYTLAEDDADYGTLDPGQSASCLDTGTCYVMGVDDPGRPATHWDATFDETLDDPDGTAKTWTLHLGDSFIDVPRSSPFYPAIETLLHSAVTGGCGAGDAYCPGGANTRAQMPVFILRALLGADYTPPPCVEGDEPFDDVPVTSTFCPWIQDLADRGIVSGCGDGDYCPGNPVTRAQMASFLLKTLEGASYDPPECSSRFTDVPCPSLFADWIEDLAARGITGGCAPNRYCPADPVTRAQMAVFVTRTFGFTLYGP